MDGFSAYKYHMAIRLHFTKDSYDIFKQHARVKCTREAFEKRNDKYLFEKVAKKYKTGREVVQFFVANMAKGNKEAVYSQEEASIIYQDWVAKQQSITKQVEQDLNTILLDAEINARTYDDVINGTISSPASIITLMLGNRISMVTVSILGEYLPVLTIARGNSKLNLFLGDTIRRTEKIKGFVVYNKDKIATLVENFKLELKDL